MDNASAMAIWTVGAVFLVGIAGCLSPSADSRGPFPEECSAHGEKDWREVRTSIEEQWAEDSPPGTPYANLGVLALRNATGTLWEDAWGPPIDWSWYSPGERPQLIQDLICLSIWRDETVPTLTPSPYWTHVGVLKELSNPALDALYDETRRQNGESEDCSFYVLFQDRRFAIQENPVHISPVYKPSSVKIAAIVPPLSSNSSGANASSEFVRLVNAGPTPENMSGWKLMGPGPNYTFDMGFELASNASVRLHTGTGFDNATDLYWGREESVWKDGVKAILWDAQGNLLDQWKVQDPATATRCSGSA